MDKVISIYKMQGYTSLQLIEKFRKDNPLYKDIKIGFAGRLDPLAHGLLILTVGEANKRRQEYLNLNKTYKFSVLFGISTDSYDYLGVLNSMNVRKVPKDFEDKIKGFVKGNTGKFIQPYPPFSSKTVNGVQLYKIAKKSKLNDLRIKIKNWPTKEIEIYSFRLVDIKSVKVQDISKAVISNLRKIRGYFRQTRIIKLWEEFFEVNSEHEFKLATFEIECSSGTYVRSLANKLGEELDCGAIAFEILRTRAGEYDIESALNASPALWLPRPG